jgi:hypothetical protein
MGTVEPNKTALGPQNLKIQTRRGTCEEILATAPPLDPGWRRLGTVHEPDGAKVLSVYVDERVFMAG